MAQNANNPTLLSSERLSSDEFHFIERSLVASRHRFELSLYERLRREVISGVNGAIAAVPPERRLRAIADAIEPIRRLANSETIMRPSQDVGAAVSVAIRKVCRSWQTPQVQTNDPS